MDAYPFQRLYNLHIATVDEIADLTRYAERVYPELYLRLRFRDGQWIDGRDFIGICANPHNHYMLEIRSSNRCPIQTGEEFVSLLKSHFDVTDL